MGKYSSYTRQKEKPRNRGVHPVMRGIGCILMIAVPIFAYGLSFVLVDYGAKSGWPLPPAWFGPPTIHPLLWQVQGLQSILQFLEAQTDLEAHLAFTAALILLIGGIMTLIYGWVYAIFGPPKYGPQDAPPIRKKVKAYKR